MLKRRVVILLCFCDGVLHRTKCFRPDYRYTQRLLATMSADEVAIVDVTPAERRAAQRHLFFGALRAYEGVFATPATVGGGVRTLDEVSALIRGVGADKVVIGAETLEADPPLARAISHKFGAQALVVAVNHREGVARLPRVAEYGELLLNSIDRDGSLLGYDIPVLRHVAGLVDVPVMVAGGCGTWKHMAEAFEAGADAACTSVIHHLTETSLAACKNWLAANCKEPVRAAA